MIPKNATINIKKHVFADNQNVESLNNNRTQVSDERGSNAAITKRRYTSNVRVIDLKL